MRPEKKAIVDEMRDQVNGSTFVILTDYRGLTVSQAEELRNQLAQVDARFRVIHNRMFKQVTKELSLDDFEASLRGPNAMVLGNGDVVEAAKVLKNFVKTNKMPVVKVGTLEGVILSAADVQRLADLPPKPVMQGQLVATIAAPMTHLVGVFSQKIASLVYVLKAVEEKKQKS